MSNLNERQAFRAVPRCDATYYAEQKRKTQLALTNPSLSGKDASYLRARLSAIEAKLAFVTHRTDSAQRGT